jgi:hypothetical protein
VDVMNISYKASGISCREKCQVAISTWSSFHCNNPIQKHAVLGQFGACIGDANIGRFDRQLAGCIFSDLGMLLWGHILQLSLLFFTSCAFLSFISLSSSVVG